MKERIARWIKNEVLKARAKGIVLGLSGGVDSSVVAALSAAAVGKRGVLGLFLPCHSYPGDLKDAKIVAKKLGIKTQTVDLSKTYENILKVLPEAEGLSQANLKPRLRMLTLYYFANKLNYLVCGTGNKSEVMVGYFTKHGDGATDILPIGDLFKKQVRALAKELGISKHIITKAPSAGFWLGQTDEGEMGLTYAELDDILGRLEQKKKQISSLRKVARVKQMIRASEHKRQGPRICYL
ncbi:MAG: NAD+ synthase [Candidatus Omnitrophota bacterium]